MITVINGVYTIQLPEFGVDQNIDPHTGHPFANEADAQAWADEFVAQQAAQQAASVAAEQTRLAAIIHVEVTADKPRAMVGDLGLEHVQLALLLHHPLLIDKALAQQLVQLTDFAGVGFLQIDLGADHVIGALDLLL